MGSRTLPSKCPHGRIWDWGDFGTDPDDGRVGAERCEECETGHRPIHGRIVGKAICEVLGLDSSQVRSITLSVDATSLATVVVERYVTVDEADQITSWLAEYALSEKTHDPGVD